MDNVHTIILLLTMAAFAATLALICSKKNKKEDYEYSQQTAEKLCRLQAGYIADAPFIGGDAKRDQAYNNCMKNFYGVMPSAYVTSTFKY